MVSQAERVIVKVGRGRYAGTELITLLERSGGVLVHLERIRLPYDHPQNMTVGGSKGSYGNYAMENADLLIAVGTRAVCQSDSSRTGYPRVRRDQYQCRCQRRQPLP